MADYPTRFEREDLLACARGELFGPGNAQLPAPPMLTKSAEALVGRVCSHGAVCT